MCNFCTRLQPLIHKGWRAFFEGQNVQKSLARGQKENPEALFLKASGSVEHSGFEPLTPTLPVWCATSCANAPNSG